MSAPPPPSAGLLSAVRADRGPVRPLAAPARRALLAALWVLPAVLLVPGLMGLRGDAATLGPVLTWGPVLLQALTGTVLVALALAAAVPGRGPARVTATLAGTLALAAYSGQAWLAHRASPGAAVADPWLSLGPACAALQLGLGLTAFAVVAALVLTAAPLRAAASGALAGAGTGLLGAGVFHLHCAVTDLRHVLPWHGGAVLLLAASGFAAGRLWERRGARRAAARLRGS